MRNLASLLAAVVILGIGGCEMDAPIATEDAGCAMPSECDAPPPGCQRMGGTCTTCGTIVCQDAGDCPVPILCAAPPEGCEYQGGTCTSCGTLVCQDGGTTCETPVECPAPPDGCEWQGGDFCTTCGKLVCDEIVCTTGIDTRFPTFDRACSTTSDCVVVEHQTDCCGTLRALGIRADAEGEFDTAEASCRGMLPGCACAAQTTRADDDTAFDGSRSARVECVSGQCTSTFGLPENDTCETGGTPCGAGLSCCYPCGIPDCDFRCEPTCAPGDPGCVDGCFLRP